MTRSQHTGTQTFGTCGVCAEIKIHLAIVKYRGLYTKKTRIVANLSGIKVLGAIPFV